MARELLMGNEAIGLGAIRAGVSLVAGYPGTPSTEILETVAKHNLRPVWQLGGVRRPRLRLCGNKRRPGGGGSFLRGSQDPGDHEAGGVKCGQ